MSAEKDVPREAVLGEIVHDKGGEPDAAWFIVGVGGYFDVHNACWVEDDPDDAPWTTDWFELFGTVEDLIDTRCLPPAETGADQ